MSLSLHNVFLENSYSEKEPRRQGFVKKNLSQRQQLTKQVLEDGWKEARKLWKASHFLTSLLALQGFSHFPARLNLLWLPPCTLPQCKSSWALCYTAWRIVAWNSTSKGQLKINHMLEKCKYLHSTQRKAACIWSENVQTMQSHSTIRKENECVINVWTSSALLFIMFSKYVLTLEGDRGQATLKGSFPKASHQSRI